MRTGGGSMDIKNSSKLEKWRKKFAAIIVAIGCLYSAIISWGDSLFMTILLMAGVLICGTIGFFDLKRAYQKRD